MSGCCSGSTEFGPITPRESDFFMFDFANPNQPGTPPLATGDAIVSATWQAEAFSFPEGFTPVDLVFSNPVITGTTDRPNSIVIAKSQPSGSAGVSYTITCIINAASGKIIEQSGLINCVERKL